MALLHIDKASNLTDPLFDQLSAGTRDVLTEDTFKRTIAVERKRTERSKDPFLLMLLETTSHQGLEKHENGLNSILSVLPSSIRETDIIGWYKHRATIGVMFTGLARNDKNAILSVILGKVSTTLRDQLTQDQFNQVTFSFHFFPDDWDYENPGRQSNPSLYPDLFSPQKNIRSLLRIKQTMDTIGSALMLAFFSPLLLVIAMAVKVSSKGPVFFRQQRVGRYGKNFTFLKFRSMRVNNDQRVHQDYVIKLITGGTQQFPSNENSSGVYKLTNDARVTRIGKVLRRTSLDELPQLVNVLKGDMSLVGPRPAIPYEFAAYQTWHRRRVLEVKPGITGLWQVTGRSRVKFDDMVRLDLRYATSWSPWLDIKILMRTPGAVLGGSGAC
jgi:lipopolysaccharide/colanic/teichoic acid biosynthesis glycosyltransferase